MNRLMIAATAALFSGPAFAADVSATIAISQPGLYGQINIGDFPRPALIYAEPIWVQRPPKVVYVQPIYLRVPPGHEKHWSKHCAEYHACGRPVYFVREDWYQTYYAPRYQHHDDHDNDQGHGDDHGNGHGNGNGNGHGNGNGNGNGKGR
jgi:hypothetical protein